MIVGVVGLKRAESSNVGKLGCNGVAEMVGGIFSIRM